MTHRETDEALALKVQRGDKEALTALVERYYQPLLGYLSRLNGQGIAQAEDMTQETFLRVIRGITLYQPARPFKTWLYTIATNIARNQYRSADARYTQNAEEEADYVDDDAPEPEAAILSSETAKRVAQALNTMPAHQREVVILFYYEELPQRDISEILHIPIGTVKSRLSLGLRHLRQQLGEAL